jgi:hypothetical protein
MLKEIISLDHLIKEDAHDLTTLFYFRALSPICSSSENKIGASIRFQVLRQDSSRIIQTKISQSH